MIDFDKILFNIDIASGMPNQGALLVAEPFLKDQYFGHSVIFLVDYAPMGNAMGIVVNTPTAYTLQGLVKGICREEEIPIWCGGPMSCDRLYYIHTLGRLIPGSREIVPGVFIGGDFDAMTEYVNSGCQIKGCLRFFIGYSGWSPGQLDDEIRNNVWAVMDLPSVNGLMLNPDASYWHRHVRMLGDDFRGWLYHPRNPQFN